MYRATQSKYTMRALLIQLNFINCSTLHIRDYLISRPAFDAFLPIYVCRCKVINLNKKLKANTLKCLQINSWETKKNMHKKIKATYPLFTWIYPFSYINVEKESDSRGSCHFHLKRIGREDINYVYKQHLLF